MWKSFRNWRRRRLLNKIDSFLAVGDRASGDLMDVLTALRGPDDGNLALKSNTTAIIRGVALPKTYRRRSRLGWTHSLAAYDMRQGNCVYLSHQSSAHFRNHVYNAAYVLGLIISPFNSTIATQCVVP